jgi:hypothetical protein
MQTNMCCCRCARAHAKTQVVDEIYAYSSHAMRMSRVCSDDAMEEDEGESGGAGGKPRGSITLVNITAREETKLTLLRDRYHVKTSYTAEGKEGKDGGLYELTLRVAASRKRIMMVALVEGVAAKCVVQELGGISATHVVEPAKKEGGDKNYSIVTEGANLDLFTLWQVNRQKNVNGALDLTRVTCNDISQIRRVLGVEAARKTLFQEIAGVFGAYGIGVDARHVSLISDSMMYSGDHRCCVSSVSTSVLLRLPCRSSLLPSLLRTRRMLPRMRTQTLTTPSPLSGQ